jgi:hypothetical protein
LVLTTYLAFRHAAVWLGPERGYLLGFLFYWIFWCLLLSLFAVGTDGLRKMFKLPRPRFGKPNWLGVLLLVGPPLVMYSASFAVEVKDASLKIILYSALFALANHFEVNPNDLLELAGHDRIQMLDRTPLDSASLPAEVRPLVEDLARIADPALRQKLVKAMRVLIAGFL